MPEARPLRRPPNASQGQPAATPAVPKTPRPPTIQKFSQEALRSLGQQHAVLTAVAPERMSFANALIPEAWGQVAYRAAKPQEWIGSDIIVHGHGYKWRANLQIIAIIRDTFKQPCGLRVACVGPSVDPKTGRAMPINVATGLPWIDPKEDIEEAA